MMMQQLQEGGPSMGVGGSYVEDGEDTVWAKDTEDAFCQALQLYPPCGRRKIVLGDEGKMYGRNELIALHIFNKTGKVRTRKQVSSHIQVLARKQQRETNQPFDGQSSAQIVTLSMGGHTGRPEHTGHPSVSTAFGRAAVVAAATAPHMSVPQFVQSGCATRQPQVHPAPQRLLLTSFNAYIRYQHTDHRHNFVAIESPGEFTSNRLESIDIVQVCDKFPGLQELCQEQPWAPMYLVKFWVDLNYDNSPSNQGLFMTTASYTSNENMRVIRSTSVLSLGKQVIEKIQVESGVPQDGAFTYQFSDAPMCEYMVKFIEKLRSIELPELVNKVLENFSVVQVLRNEENGEVLCCKAFMFETSLRGYGARHNIYRLFAASGGQGDRRFTA